jgi:hypothetical protein
MITLLRRFLVLVALSFWLGGFTFYASVVVPIGQHVLKSHTRQGFITREVTVYLNLSGAIALLMLAWDTAAVRDAASWRRWGRWLMWAGMVVTLGLLFWLHPQLDDLMNQYTSGEIDDRLFRAGHRLYLWTSTIQWGCGVAYTVLTISSWRSEDREQRGKA